MKQIEISWSHTVNFKMLYIYPVKRDINDILSYISPIFIQKNLV